LAIVLSVLLSFGHCVVCSSVFWPLCCLFFDLRILIAPLVSSNSSCPSFFLIPVKKGGGGGTSCKYGCLILFRCGHLIVVKSARTTTFFQFINCLW
jgi:hypothetical protein